MKARFFSFILMGIFLTACVPAALSSGALSSEPKISASAVETPTARILPTQQPSSPAKKLPAATTQPKEVRSKLPDLGTAPELENKVWLNTDHPLRLKDLRGKVVLLEMWTFDCINCQHTIPSLRGWYEKYSSQGLVIIGNHFPEFGYEKDLANLKEAIQRLDVPYPVAQDNDGQTWNAYNNRYWPTAYLIDKRGHVRFIQIGEGNYQRTEAAIQDLLSETVNQ